MKMKRIPLYLVAISLLTAFPICHVFAGGFIGFGGSNVSAPIAKTSSLGIASASGGTMTFGEATGCDQTGTIQDTFINVNSTNYSTGSLLNTYTWPVNTIANAIIIKWDLSVISSSATIQNATLYLYLSSMDGGGGDTLYDLTVHKIINHNPIISACTGYTYDGTNGWTPCNGIPLAQ